jgi:uncharacterized protein YjbI with pentapeptide repeats
MVALVGVALEIYDNWKKDIQTDEDRACNSIIKIVFSTTEDLLKTIRKNFLDGKEIEIDTNFDKRKEILENFFKPFKEYSDDDSFSDLTDHPVVTKFKSRIIKQLKEKYQSNEEIIVYFEENFDPKFENKIEQDLDIQKIEDIKKRRTQNKELKNYLEYVIKESEKDSIKDLGKDSSGGRYYIENREAVLADISKWNSTDTNIKENYGNDITNAEKIIDDFLKKEHPPKRYLFIGASFGMGKTTLAKKIASKYANDFLERNGKFIPIIVLNNRLRKVYGDYNLDNVLNRIIAPDKNSNEKAFGRKILLILDGLDDYSDNSNDAKNLIDKIETIFGNYRNVKVIITTRLQYELPNKLPIIGEQYLRLLPFSEQQVEDFFNHYNIKLTYNDIKSLALNEQELTKPLLAWMFSQIPGITGDFQHIKPEEKLTRNMTKSLIYLNFFHYIITGKPVDPQSVQDKERIRKLYLDEKKAMRSIAVINQIYGKGKLTQENVKQGQKIFGYSIDIPDLDRILNSYFYLVKEKKNEKVIDFVHETFKEYLLAEHYLECLLKEDRISWMNVGIPSEVTIGFLEGLIELLNRKDDNFRRFIDYNDDDDISLLNSFEYKDGIYSAKEQIINNALRSINQEQKVLLPNVDGMTGISMEVYENTWKHRWISLYVLNTLAPGLYSTRIKKPRLEKLITNKSEVIPYYIKKLKQLDLSGSNLIGINLSNAVLSGAILDRSDLSDSNLSKADLSDTNLSHANLSEAKLPNANLSNANLSNANLLDAKLSEANLSIADLSNVNLKDANLSDANLSDAKLPEANLSYADLTNADLTNADLTNADLSRANLSEAKLPNATLSYANLSNANLSNADLTNADLSYASLFSSDLSNAKLKNTTFELTRLARGTLTNADLSYAIISNSDLSYADLTNALLTFSLLLGCKLYNNMICERADFQDALTDNQDLMLHLEKNNAKTLPLLLNSKSELKNKLKERGKEEDKIELLLKQSSLGSVSLSKSPPYYNDQQIGETSL